MASVTVYVLPARGLLRPVSPPRRRSTYRAPSLLNRLHRGKSVSEIPVETPPFRFYERERNEGASILRGLLIAGGVSIPLWALIIWGVTAFIGLFV